MLPVSHSRVFFCFLFFAFFSFFWSDYPLFFLFFLLVRFLFGSVLVFRVNVSCVFDSFRCFETVFFLLSFLIVFRFLCLISFLPDTSTFTFRCCSC